ncbi:MAG: tRNA threonylcarbamoyladenosine dehydratase [Fibrobacter sp.]|nr:tRNA threonylcarbamoyladenosine dehydratase [Fibrobacter sp.]
MEKFSRTGLLLGESAVRRLGEARVGVFGLGGVGSYAVETLARSGVGYLRIIDFDTVKYSNFNRQLFATEETVNGMKVDAAEKRIFQINPECKVEKRAVFVDESTVGELLEGIDVVVDAIDSVSSKASLLVAVSQAQISSVTSMGAAARTDPFAVRVGDISESSVCPLARIIRKRIHRRGVYTGIRCVYSVEQVDTASVSQYDKNETWDRGRERPSLGSISYMTGIFGLITAHEAIKLILESNKVPQSMLQCSRESV